MYWRSIWTIIVIDAESYLGLKHPPSPISNQVMINQYDIGCRGCALMSSLLTANWDRQTGGRAQVSIGMHAHPKTQEHLALF